MADTRMRTAESRLRPIAGLPGPSEHWRFIRNWFESAKPGLNGSPPFGCRSQLNWYSITRPFCFRNVQITKLACPHHIVININKYRLSRPQWRTVEIDF